MRAIPLRELNYVVIDFETTGLDAQTGDEIVEIGAVKIEGLQVIGKSFHALVNPQREIPEQAVRVHGISNKQVQKSPTIEQTMPAFLDFLGAGIVAAQNAKFDMSFLIKNLVR